MNMREIRQLKGIYQTDLARMVGINQPLISLIENGEVMPTLQDRYKIELALGMPVDWSLEPLIEREVIEECTTT